MMFTAYRENRIPRLGVYAIGFVLIVLTLGCSTSDLMTLLFPLQANTTTAVDTVPDRYASIPQSRTGDKAFVLGNPDAAITIVEFADFLCIHCQRYEPTVHQFIDQYVATGLAKFEFRMFPVVNQDTAPFAAQLAECSNKLKQGGFWTARDILFEIADSTEFTADPVATLVERMGISQDKLMLCAPSAQQYVTDSELAFQTGITGVTSVWVRYQNGDLEPAVVGGEVYQGAIDLDILAAVIKTNNGRSNSS